MARPIRNTPILMGSDASAFIRAAERKQTPSQLQSERARLDASVERFMTMLAKLPK